MNTSVDFVDNVTNFNESQTGDLDDGSKILYLVAVPLLLTCLVVAFLFNSVILVCCFARLPRPFSRSLSFSISLVAAGGYSAFYLATDLIISSLL